MQKQEQGAVEVRMTTARSHARYCYGILALALRTLIDWLTYRIVLGQRQAAAATSMQAPTVTSMQPGPPHQPTPPQG